MHASHPAAITGVIVPGHRVASGLNGDPRFPGGTIHMQRPHFAALGLDLSGIHPGTLNVSIAPRKFHVKAPRHVFRGVKWHPVEPAEDFSFFDVTLHTEDRPGLAGWIYLPHPDTKPEHFQDPDVLELLLPWTEGLRYGSEIMLEVPFDQMTFEIQPPAPQP